MQAIVYIQTTILLKFEIIMIQSGLSELCINGN